MSLKKMIRQALRKAGVLDDREDLSLPGLNFE
jgi:hypothetical protein